MSAWIKPRDGQGQQSPWFRANPVKPSSALSRKASWAPSTSEKKMLGLLPPSSRVTGIRFWLAYCMISRPVVVSPVNAILAIRGLEASGLPASRPKPLTILRTPGGRRSATSSIQTMIEAGVCSGGLGTTQIAGSKRRRKLPARHQEREVPRNDLPDHAERLVEVIGDRVLVDFGERAL